MRRCVPASNSVNRAFMMKAAPMDARQAVKSILLGGLTAGVLDIAYAMIAAMSAGRSPARPVQGRGERPSRRNCVRCRLGELRARHVSASVDRLLGGRGLFPCEHPHRSTARESVPARRHLRRARLSRHELRRAAAIGRPVQALLSTASADRGTPGAHLPRRSPDRILCSTWVGRWRPTGTSSIGVAGFDHVVTTGGMNDPSTR